MINKYESVSFSNMVLETTSFSVDENQSPGSKEFQVVAKTAVAGYRYVIKNSQNITVDSKHFKFNGHPMQIFKVSLPKGLFSKKNLTIELRGLKYENKNYLDADNFYYFESVSNLKKVSQIILGPSKI